jgi:hypothetical protein
MTYQVRDWDKHFENNKSRERDRLSFVCIPNKQHGLGFARIMAEPDGAAIYGIWHCITGACSQQSRPRHGWLTDTGRAPGGHQAGTPWAPADLALKFRRPVEEVKRALDVLCSKDVGWVVCVAQVPAECPPSAPQVPAECPGREGKGREGKGRNGSEGGAPAAPTDSNSKTEEAINPQAHFPEANGSPARDEVLAVADRLGLAQWKAADWFDEMQGCGWLDYQGRQIKNWQAVLSRVRTKWESDGRPSSPPKPASAKKGRAFAP